MCALLFTLGTPKFGLEDATVTVTELTGGRVTVLPTDRATGRILRMRSREVKIKFLRTV